MRITEEQLIVKLVKLSMAHPIKCVDGEIRTRTYYQVGDLVLSFYFPERFQNVQVYYRGTTVAYFNNVKHILYILEGLKDNQTEEEFRI